MQADTIISSSSAGRPSSVTSALSTGNTEQAPAKQRLADAAALRPSPVDEAQLSPLARQLSAQEEFPEAQQQRTDERLQPQREQIEQQQGLVAARGRFEVVA
jgi:hypothetical protein